MVDIFHLYIYMASSMEARIVGKELTARPCNTIHSSAVDRTVPTPEATPIDATRYTEMSSLDKNKPLQFQERIKTAHREAGLRCAISHIPLALSGEQSMEWESEGAWSTGSPQSMASNTFDSRATSDWTTNSMDEEFLDIVRMERDDSTELYFSDYYYSLIDKIYRPLVAYSLEARPKCDLPFKDATFMEWYCCIADEVFAMFEGKESTLPRLRKMAKSARGSVDKMALFRSIQAAGIVLNNPSEIEDPIRQGLALSQMQKDCLGYALFYHGIYTLQLDSSRPAASLTLKWLLASPVFKTLFTLFITKKTPLRMVEHSYILSLVLNIKINVRLMPTHGESFIPLGIQRRSIINFGDTINNSQYTKQRNKELEKIVCGSKHGYAIGTQGNMRILRVYTHMTESRDGDPYTRWLQDGNNTSLNIFLKRVVAPKESFIEYANYHANFKMSNLLIDVIVSADELIYKNF